MTAFVLLKQHMGSDELNQDTFEWHEHVQHVFDQLEFNNGVQ